MTTADDVEKKTITACNAVVAHTDTVLCLLTADTQGTPSRVSVLTIQPIEDGEIR
jgi:hypothetical protein